MRWGSTWGMTHETSSGITKSRFNAYARAGGAREHQRATRADAQLKPIVVPGRVNDLNHVFEDALVHVYGGHLLLDLADLVQVHDRFDVIERLVVRVRLENIHLDLGSRVADRQAHQKAIQLRLGKRVGAVKLDRVLRRDDHERLGQRPALAFNGGLALVHRFQQRRLRSRRRPVDFVGQQDVAEDRPRVEPEIATDGVVDRRAEDVGRQQIGSELNPAVLRIDAPSQRLGQCRLAHARHVFDQDRPPRQQGHDQNIDAVALAKNDALEVPFQRDHSWVFRTLGYQIASP